MHNCEIDLNLPNGVEKWSFAIATTATKGTYVAFLIPFWEITTLS